MTNTTTKTSSRRTPAKRAPRKPAAKKSTDKMTVVISEFEKAIATVKPFASADTTLPMINSVVLQMRDRTLTIAATDRFTMGANVIRPVFPDDNKDLPGDFEVVIRLIELPILLGALKRSDAKLVNRVELTITGNQIVVDGVRVGDPDLSGKFPDWRKIVAEAEVASQGTPQFGEVAMNPTYLRKFAQIKPRPHLRVSSESKPILAVSENFIGVLMPVRIAQDRASVLASFGIAVLADAASKDAAA